MAVKPYQVHGSYLKFAWELSKRANIYQYRNSSQYKHQNCILLILKINKSISIELKQQSECRWRRSSHKSQRATRATL